MLISYTGCDNNNQAKHYTSVSAILHGRPITYLAFKNYPSGKLRYLLDSVEGKSFGNLFEFFQNSAIKSYSFITDKSQSTYIETFDSVSHKVISIQGIPIVYKTIDADMHPDSLAVEYLISDFSWDDVQISFSGDGKTFTNASLYQHPVLKFIRIAKLQRETKSVNSFFLITMFKGKLKNSENYRMFFDTIDLKRNLPK